MDPLAGAADGSLLRVGALPGYVPERKASEYLRDCQVYFTTEAEEANLPLVLQFVGEDRIMIACDQPHEEAREGTVGRSESAMI